MENRNFQLDTEWSIVHYPYQPNGFGILIIGDERSFVEKDLNFWTQNEGRLTLINHFKEKGYTAFYSNLYGKHWGSNKATKLAKQLYYYVIRREILNEKIHIFAEGMGALVALRLLEELKGKIRSIVLVNPIYSLKSQLEHEKEHKFFYKKLTREIAAAYEIDPKQVEAMIEGMEEIDSLSTSAPMKIIHLLNGSRAYKQSALTNLLMAKLNQDGAVISVSYLLPEKMTQLKQYTCDFYKSFETEL
ncbi:hydrolase [Bacillus sp. DNRA2]|nr:hydrolase [Bacillus sp. DNRA2]NMD70803.1 hydrolase [Bacillus sp. DNRA2]